MQPQHDESLEGEAPVRSPQRVRVRQTGSAVQAGDEEARVRSVQHGVAQAGAMIIDFSAFDVVYCALVAERRNVVKEPTGTVNLRKCNRTDFEVHMLGAMGELAAARWLGVSVDTSVAPSGDDKITDLVVGTTRVQVKARTVQEKPVYLFFNRREQFQADVAVLALVLGPARVQIAGWIRRQEFLEQAVSMDFGYGPRVVVPEGKLNPSTKRW